ncbi:LexA family protein [Pseudomonas folii]|uniref:LexA family transcriptional regulator n=1 Tax=Pseudomonas folii TaxID=2762593 RepID=A0ABR7ATS4_9PSED|nr:LexA family transcriptional regulator [Pseudomonas folii]MBC3948323.1 LexA family transcriptional regulator [Pseudomonas folii]
MNTTGSRIAASREKKGMNQSELGRALGVSPQSVQAWESDKNVPRPQRLKAISEALGVSVSYLMGESDPEPQETSNVGPVRQPKLLYHYPVVSWVTAGAWTEAVQPFPDGFSDRYEPSDYNSKGAAFWLEVRGDSMTSLSGTSIPEGMLILVDTEADVRPGKFVIAKLPNSEEATFKKLVEDAGRRYLKPLNPAYSMIECSDDCRIIGVAVRMTGTL